MEFSDNLVQFYPNRITVSPRIVRDWQYSLEKKAGLHQKLANLAKRKTSVNLSASSKKEIRDSIFSMYQLSKPRTQKVGSGKFIYNFRQSFVTLTLPSRQVHSDVEIKKCMNAFLTNVRRSFNIQNYVWKAELQQNENIHFHLSFDKYIPFQAVRYYWLLALKPLGYVDAYCAKFSKMSLSQYAKYRGLSLVDASKPYADGCRSSWQSPNCVDVSAVTTASSVSNYLSKYFAKNDDQNLDAARIASFGKVWARSTSLSRLKYKNKFEYREIKRFIEQLMEMKAVKKVCYDFSTVFYINFKAFSGVHKKWFMKLLFCNGERYCYPFPVP
jgi:hypothetical protein